MPSFFDEKFKVYRHREVIRLPNGETVRLIASGESKAKAKAAFEAKRLETLNLGPKRSRAGAGSAPAASSKAFATFAEEWLVTYPKAAKNRDTTLAEKTYHVRVRLLPYFEKLGEARGAPIMLSDLSPKVIDRLVADLSDAPKLAAGPEAQRERALKSPKKLSAQTVRNIMQTFRKMLVSAKRWGEIEVMPEIPSVKVPRAKFDFLKFDEVERLLTAIETKGPVETRAEDLALIMTGVRAGLRAGELLGLQWGDVDLVRKELRIEFQLPIGKVGKGTDGARSGKKSASTKSTGALSPTRVPVKAGVRTVPMTDSLAAALKSIRHLRAQGRGDWVHCDADGRPFTRDDLKRKLEIYLRRAGLRRVHPHVMRHTFASHLAMKGVPLIQIKEWLGHTSIQTTMRYAHLAPTEGKSRVNVLDAPSEGTGS